MGRWEDIGLTIIGSSSITDYRMWEVVGEQFGYLNDGNRWNAADTYVPQPFGNNNSADETANVPKAYQFKMSDHFGSFAPFASFVSIHNILCVAPYAAAAWCAFDSKPRRPSTAATLSDAFHRRSRSCTFMFCCLAAL